ncbi:WAT1-related protein At3g28050 [Eucalyptus grandis]|uniref:WAT1-related protein At3g28050 n=1 Tax=Eucalyptus grandis TaxID=71139 RepID=UPI00192F0583|nr:WAT1-related protein At3g28050 [Eucalyptus grandis]
MARRRCDWYMEVLLFMAMVVIESICVGVYTLFKAATLRGLSHHVFVVYAYAVSVLVLLPAPFMSYRSRALPPLSLAILAKIGLLGLIGGLSQIMGYTGISFSSPTLNSALSNLTPALTFILAILFRMEKVSLKSSSSQAKIIGTILSISGAFVVTLYKGPPVITAALKWPFSFDLLLSSSSSNWVLGGAFLTAEYILVPLYYIVMAQIMEDYPAELTVPFFHNIFVCIIAAIVALAAEHDANAWRVSDVGLASVICSGLFAHCLRNCFHVWAIRLKGPFYVAMFKPASVVIAILMGFFFLGDALYLGSLIGAIIMSIGFYSVLWGKAKEETNEEPRESVTPSPPSQNVPLLPKHHQSH